MLTLTLHTVGHMVTMAVGDMVTLTVGPKGGTHSRTECDTDSGVQDDTS